MDGRSSVARQVLDTARAHGADTVFGLQGVHNLVFSLVVRHEQAAV
ncbi:MAG: hypothetical protein L0I24_14215 [Pseudonocardia sp.]|nr:hypothetical protein [Pseudonocardia sp.]